MISKSEISAIEKAAIAAESGNWYEPCFCDDWSACNCRTLRSDEFDDGVATIHIGDGKCIEDGGNGRPSYEKAKDIGRYIGMIGPRKFLDIVRYIKDV